MSSPLAGRPSRSSPHTPSRAANAAQPSVTPGSFSSQSYLPASTTDALEARRAAFFQQQPSSSTSSSSTTSTSSAAPRPPRRPPSSYLRPGPSPAAGPSPHDRSRAFKRPPSALFSSGSASGPRSSPSRRLLDGGSETGGSGPGSPNDDTDVSSRLYRQRFQQRCQAAIAREKGRQRAVARARGRDVLSSPVSGGDDAPHILNSDDLSSSDLDEDSQSYVGGDAWQYEDDELVRRVMLSEYRRLLQKQEVSGRHELGWLGADEVAWLEEELARGGGEGEEQPPLDVVDEGWALAEQFDHAFGDEVMEGEAWDEDTLRAIEEMEMAQQQQQQQQQAGDVDMDMT